MPFLDEIPAHMNSWHWGAFGLLLLSLEMILPGFFFQAKTATAAPKGKPQALAFVTEFIAQAKASGLMRRVFDANGLQSQAVAP